MYNSMNIIWIFAVSFKISRHCLRDRWLPIWTEKLKNLTMTKTAPNAIQLIPDDTPDSRVIQMWNNWYELLRIPNVIKQLMMHVLITSNLVQFAVWNYTVRTCSHMVIKPVPLTITPISNTVCFNRVCQWPTLRPTPIDVFARTFKVDALSRGHSGALTADFS